MTVFAVILVGAIIAVVYGPLVFASTSPTSHDTAVDIQVLNVVPGISTTQVPGQLSQSDIGVTVIDSGSNQFNFTSVFAFTPMKGFTIVDSLHVALLYTSYSWNTGDSFSVRINGLSIGSTPEKIYQVGYPLTVSSSLSGQSLVQGSNIIDIGINQGGTAPSQVYLYEVRLSVDYTYLA